MYVLDITNESLEDASKQFKATCPNGMRDNDIFKAGANWQKEKDRALQDKLIEALNKIKTNKKIIIWKLKESLYL